MDEKTVSLMNKNVNDLTVGDALKINIVIVAAMVAVPVVIGSVITVKDAVTSRVRERKARKTITIVKDK